MAVNPVGAAGSSASLGQSEFLQLLLTQIQYQDPMKPINNQEFLAQMAQFSSLAQTQQINESVTALLGYQAWAQTVGLIGRKVSIDNGDGSTTGGTVSAIDLTKADPELSVTISAGITFKATLSQVTAVTL